MDIIACPNCGSRKIYQGTMGDGVLSGYTSRDVCRTCGYQGIPIIFSSDEEYRKFLKEKTTENASNQRQKIKKDKFVKKERPIGLTILSFIIILLAILSIALYYQLLWVKVIDFLWIYYISIFIISALVLPYGFLKGKEWAWTFGGILFALSIPIGLIFLFYITRPHVKIYFGKN